VPLVTTYIRLMLGCTTICEASETLVRISVDTMSSRLGSSEMRKLTIEVVGVDEECESSAWRFRPLELHASE
jgi:hypothetical protein